MGRNGRGDRSATDGGAEVVVERGPEESLTRAILRSVAALKGVAERDLDTLYESVDVEALESLVRHSSARDSRVRVEFTFQGCTVVVRGGETIRIAENQPPRSEEYPGQS
ncbi:HalOD1 output domain-containing protein [Natronoarchaeum mannanilyticum]|uniref:Halobacterial output domain-containing protein n=1 Tax=Natronoarchaeum mannanilyticum TaxID=926360 RepID=A0AAV3TCG2_9EURY